MRWIKKNSLSLGGLALAVALTVGSWYVTTWLPSPRPSSTEAVVSVDADDSTAFHGYEISRLIALREPEAESYLEIPDGTQIVAVALDLGVAEEFRLPEPDYSDPDYTLTPQTPELTLPECSMTLTEQDAPHRTWTPTGVDLELEETTAAGYPFVYSCGDAYADHYRLATGFLLPDGVTGPFFFDVTLRAFDETRTLRYSIAP